MNKKAQGQRNLEMRCRIVNSTTSSLLSSGGRGCCVVCLVQWFVPEIHRLLLLCLISCCFLHHILYTPASPPTPTSCTLTHLHGWRNLRKSCISEYETVSNVTSLNNIICIICISLPEIHCYIGNIQQRAFSEKVHRLPCSLNRFLNESKTYLKVDALWQTIHLPMGEEIKYLLLQFCFWGNI